MKTLLLKIPKHYQLIYRLCLRQIEKIRRHEKEKGIYAKGWTLAFENIMNKGKLKKGEKR